MPVKNFLRDLIKKADEADRSLDELAIAVAEGGKVNDEVIERTCLLGGVSLRAFANRIEVLEERRAVWDAVHDRDWEADRKAVRAKLSESRAASESVATEIAALQAESRRLSDIERGLSHEASKLSDEEREARQACEVCLRKSGSPDDWRALVYRVANR